MQPVVPAELVNAKMDSKIKIKKRLREAVIANDLQELIKLSDTAKLIEYVQRATGNNLLQIAVLHQSKEIFDYLLAIEDYPLNHKNKKGQTALNLCFDDDWKLNFEDRRDLEDEMQVSDQLACALIKRGISLDCVTLDRDETLLHYAIRKNFVEVPKLLMQMGHDVNARNVEGITPLWLAIHGDSEETEKTELVSALLYYDANLTMETCFGTFSFLDHAVRCHYYLLQEILFNYLVDDFTSMDVPFRTLMILAQEGSRHFRSVAEHINTVSVDNVFTMCHQNLFKIHSCYLNILIKTCPDVIRKVSRQSINFEELMDRGISGKRFLENLSLLLESDLRDDFIEIINDQLNCHNILQYDTDESVVFERICFLLSYGITINEYTLNTFYGRFGFGELFKVVVDMEVQPLRPEINYPCCPEPIYSIHFDLEQILANLSNYRRCSQSDVLKLVEHFSDPRLREFSMNIVARSTKLSSIVANQPQIPLLVELARNVFQRFFIGTRKIETPLQFYRLVGKLPIPRDHMKIIRLEKKLY